MTLTIIPRDQWLDLDQWIGQRVATFRFQHINGVTGQIYADLTPLRDTVPTLTHDVTRTIKRTIDGIAFGLTDTQTIDTIQDRILVSMIVEGVGEYPLGRYMFLDQTRQRFAIGLLSTAVMTDEMQIVDQQLSTGFAAYPIGGFVNVTAERLLADYPVSFAIEASPYRSGGAWTAGTSAAKVLEDLSVDGDYWSPWFDNNGVLRMIRSFDPADEIPDLDFDEGNKVLADTIAESDDLINAPNRIVVISNGAEDNSAPAVGIYDIPSSAPHSIQNRGFVIADVRDMQVVSEVQAVTTARNIGLRQTIYQRVDLATAPDPRHDGFQVIRWQGVNWLELGWSLPLIEGGQMRHTLRRSYQ